jgi:hypothetical protein
MRFSLNRTFYLKNRNFKHTINSLMRMFWQKINNPSLITMTNIFDWLQLIGNYEHYTNEIFILLYEIMKIYL